VPSNDWPRLSQEENVVKMGMSAAKFGVNDPVRLIGTDTVQTVMQYNPKTLEYQLKSGGDEAVPVWILGIYLEPVEASKKPAAGTNRPTR
jgi:hypothetical protein